MECLDIEIVVCLIVLDASYIACLSCGLRGLHVPGSSNGSHSHFPRTWVHKVHIHGSTDPAMVAWMQAGMSKVAKSTGNSSLNLEKPKGRLQSTYHKPVLSSYLSKL